MTPADAAARRATRLLFLVAGFGLACWAPLVPLARSRLGAGDAALGGLLLCLGAGSVVAMQLGGSLAVRLGARPVALGGGAGLAAMLPLLACAPTAATLGAALVVFGAFLGALEVGMNVHAVEVEARAGRPLMSGFHGLFSVGGFAGATLMTAVLSARVGAVAGTVAAAVLMAGCLALAAPGLVRSTDASSPPWLVLPRGIVVLLAGLAALTFLSEGAILDWGALLLTGRGLLDRAGGGAGYMAFALAMTAGRLGGDRLVGRLGDRRTMVAGGLLAVAGLVVALAAPTAAVAIAGFLMVGLGAANTVPILYRQAGRQRRMPAGLAVAAISTVGYAGILAGPGLIGVVAQVAGLPGAFAMVAGLLCLVPLAARRATGSGG